MVLALLFLPVQMRAGAEAAHSHSLLHLLLDARDGEIDHHHDEGDHAHAHQTQPGDECRVNPDIPSLEETRQTGSVSMLSAIVVILAVPVERSRAIWPTGPSWHAHHSRPEHPPPRCQH